MRAPRILRSRQLDGARRSALPLALAALALAACTVSLPGGDAAGTGEVTVVATYPDGTPVDGLTTEWSPEPEDSGGVLCSAGRCRFPRFSAGQYRLTVSSSGARPTTVDVEVAPGEEQTVEVTLQPQG